MRIRRGTRGPRSAIQRGFCPVGGSRWLHYFIRMNYSCASLTRYAQVALLHQFLPLWALIRKPSQRPAPFSSFSFFWSFLRHSARKKEDVEEDEEEEKEERFN